MSTGTAGSPESNSGDTRIRQDLMLIARMFMEYREDPIMRELCHLAIKCTQDKVTKLTE